MAHILDDFDPLSPLAQPPSAGPTPTQASYTSTTKRDRERSQDIDKFSTLFSPSTPRASPTLIPVPDAPSSSIFTSSNAMRYQTHKQRARSISSLSDDFGSFVSVSAYEDPLSTNIQTFDDDQPPPPVKSSAPSPLSLSRAPSPILPPSVVAPSQPVRKHGEVTNVSMLFFDKFVEDAKKASEAKRRSVLDELLLHQDDPLYFLKEETPVVALDGNGVGHTADLVRDEETRHIPLLPPPPPASPLPPPISRTTPPPTTTVPTPTTNSSSNSLLDLERDLDHDFFTSKPTPPKTHANRGPHSRSPSIPAPTLAPPLTSSPLPSHVLFDPLGSSNMDNDQDRDEGHKRPALTTRSSSYQTLSTLPGRWMSTLLRSSGSQPQQQRGGGGGARPALESIFNPHTDASPSSAYGAVPSSSSTSPLHRRKSSSPSAKHARTLPASTSTPNPHFSPQPAQTMPTFSHRTPFAPPASAAITHAQSPFAIHVYAPPSGAPGFKGEGLDWDKGFSRELEEEGVRDRRERERERGRLMLQRENDVVERAMGGGMGVGVVGVQRDRWGGAPVGGGGGGNVVGGGDEPEEGGGIGAYMDKKNAINLELKGRRAATTPVLSSKLAILLRPHLPALSRLPRTWTLIYSLDQHGISLNTLYSNCERHAQPPPRSATTGMGMSDGMMVVVKDAGDAVFGVWVSEGLGRGKGKGYFGGGESFLWKYERGSLKVYKTTGKNNYVALCESNYISFGGGDGQYGLYLDDTLFDGSSAPCPTFDNEPLCSPGPRKAGAVGFECVGLEVWGVGP